MKKLSTYDTIFIPKTFAGSFIYEIFGRGANVFQTFRLKLTFSIASSPSGLVRNRVWANSRSPLDPLSPAAAAAR